jgi:FdhD protein
MKKETTVKRYRSGRIIEETDYVAAEENVQLIINGTTALTVSLSPVDLEAFAYGFLLTSGLIATKEEIEAVDVKGKVIGIRIKRELENVNFFLPSGCGGGSLPDIELAKPAFAETVIPGFETLPVLFKQFNRYSVIFEETGGVHSAAICRGESICFFSEDIGRHNAVDKVIGKGMIEGIDFSTHFLLTSGRISGEIVKKALYAGLRSIVSRSAPTCAAIVRARRANIGIIGFLRGTRFNIYT